MDFLRTHGEPGSLVVYAGASPGLHIPKLAELFPDLRFLLIDSAPYRAPDCDRVEILHLTDPPFSEETMVRRPFAVLVFVGLSLFLSVCLSLCL